MITVKANARCASYCSDDLITSGSIGIPARFDLSADFDGLSNVAVFEGSGASIDVIIVDGACVVPHEVLATAGGYLRIGVYGRNGAGTIAIPTIWAGCMMILPGAEPSGIDPAEPTPDWTAQVQAAATEALSIAQNVADLSVASDTLAPGSDATVEKAVAPDGSITLVFGIPRGDSGADGQNGAPGADGYSPTASVSKKGGTATITITDKNGTTTATVSDGQNGTNGQDGAPGVGVPSGGTDGQMLVKDGATDYSMKWANQPSVPVTDVQLDGTSVVNEGIASIPAASNSALGAVQGTDSKGVSIVNGEAKITTAADNDIKMGTEVYKPIVPINEHKAVFFGLAKVAGDTSHLLSQNPVGTYTEDAKSKISEMLNGSVSVSGSTPTITALPGVQYVCGEVSTLAIEIPASGCFDVVFESGSTATALSFTLPTAEYTLVWENGFDPTSLDANTTYEINIKIVGTKCLGVVGQWT